MLKGGMWLPPPPRFSPKKAKKQIIETNKPRFFTGAFV